MTEREQALEIAKRWLDFDMNPLVQMVPGDPDCDACVLARQYIRAIEASKPARIAIDSLPYYGRDKTDEGLVPGDVDCHGHIMLGDRCKVSHGEVWVTPQQAAAAVEKGWRLSGRRDANSDLVCVAR